MRQAWAWRMGNFPYLCGEEYVSEWGERETALANAMDVPIVTRLQCFPRRQVPNWCSSIEWPDSSPLHVHGHEWWSPERPSMSRERGFLSRLRHPVFRDPEWVRGG
jgi:hypothetical protein